MGDKGARRSQSALLALALTPPCFARGGENDDDGVLGDEDEEGVLDDDDTDVVDDDEEDTDHNYDDDE